jgi:P4 family phage/plasmid primase-like protien
MSAAEEDFDDLTPPVDDLEDWTPSTRDDVRVARTFQIADHVEIARALVDELGGADNLVHDEGHSWRYDASGLHLKIDRDVESRIVQGFSGTPTAPNGKPLRVKAADVSGAIRLAHDQIAKPGYFADAPAGVMFSNGFLRVTEKGAELVPLAREHRARAGYSFAYERACLPRRFLGFLDALFRDDEDRCEKTSYVQEFFGACLLGIATTYQRCTYAIGGGDNGKSRLADVMLPCMPAGTTSAIPPQDWHQEYRRAMLAGIRLNAVGELPERDIVASEAFKAIVAGDPIVARIIRESPVMLRPIAGHYFAANGLPGSPDQTDGFWRRPVVLTFNRSFKNDPTRDPHVATRIIAEERPAIVSWLIDGGLRLLRSNEYTIPPSHHAALAAWRKGANQVALFVDDETKADSSGGVAAADLYSAYLRWTERNRHRALASNSFGQRMKLLGHEPRKTMAGWRYPLAFLTAADRACANDRLAEPMTDSPACN